MNLSQFAARLEEAVKARIKSGVGADGSPFPRKKDGAASNLVDTGALVNSIQAEVTKDLVVVVAPKVSYAEAVEARRPYMGFTQVELAVVDQELEQLVDEALEELK